MSYNSMIIRGICRCFCQAQPQFHLSWALFLIPPAAHQPTHPPGMVVNKQEIISTCFITLEGLI